MSPCSPLLPPVFSISPSNVSSFHLYHLLLCLRSTPERSLPIFFLASLPLFARAFSMEKVLAQSACFQPLRDAGQMQLSPNCLVHLEVI